MDSIRSLLRVACSALAFLAFAASAQQSSLPLTGAIFTTLSDGTRVNANIYSAKCDALGVYLDGGPGPNAPQGAAGLPDGDYFYQVTDPSGKTLLSTDPQKFRRFTVTGGIITARVAPQAAGDHQTGIDVDYGALTVELCPYLNTPNNGGEYKVWVTRVGDFAGNPDLVDNGYNPSFFHGFIPSQSKTDNFKVKSRKSACLTIVKYLENGDGVYSSLTEPLKTWAVTVTDAAGTPVRGKMWTGDGTSANPELKVCALPPGTYTITEDSFDPAGVLYFPITVILDGNYIRPAFGVVNVTMGNTDRNRIFGTVRKYVLAAPSARAPPTTERWSAVPFFAFADSVSRRRPPHLRRPTPGIIDDAGQHAFFQPQFGCQTRCLLAAMPIQRIQQRQSRRPRAFTAQQRGVGFFAQAQRRQSVGQGHLQQGLDQRQHAQGEVRAGVGLLAQPGDGLQHTPAHQRAFFQRPRRLALVRRGEQLHRQPAPQLGAAQHLHRVVHRLHRPRQADGWAVGVAQQAVGQRRVGAHRVGNDGGIAVLRQVVQQADDAMRRSTQRPRHRAFTAVAQLPAGQRDAATQRAFQIVHGLQAQSHQSHLGQQLPPALGREHQGVDAARAGL